MDNTNNIKDNIFLSPDSDPMGTAIAEYHAKGRAARLRVFSPDFDEDEIPVASLFRTYELMSPIEQKAIDLSVGRTLDVGAGSGCHSLELQKRGVDTVAIDISELSVRTMLERGVRSAHTADFFNAAELGRFDTILMLMNGAGIIGRLERMDAFFATLKCMLNPGGQVLLDSSDIRFVFEDEDGNFEPPSDERYYGEMDYTMQYRSVKGKPFSWLYVDFETLSMYASQNGFRAELAAEGAHYDYLARLTAE